MNTKIYKLSRDNIDCEIIKLAAEDIKDGKLVAFPTETVYGLGADGLNPNAIEKIFKAKGRPQDNPLILHVYNIEQVEELVEEINDNTKKVMEKFWPGPLTILFKKSDLVPNEITAGLDTVAIRMPEDKIALRLIEESNTAIAGPSANLSGRPSPTTAEHVKIDLEGKIDTIIDGGSTGIGLESTVVDLSGDEPMILRPGGITFEQLKEIIPNITVDSSIIKEGENIVPKSPGQKYRHYAPKSKMILYNGEVDNIVSNINIEIEEYLNKGYKVGVMATDETMDRYVGGEIISMGTRSNRETIAHNLFKVLRDFDELDVDIILGEGVPKSGIGIAIMNRLMKAASGNIFTV